MLATDLEALQRRLATARQTGLPRSGLNRLTPLLGASAVGSVKVSSHSRYRERHTGTRPLAPRSSSAATFLRPQRPASQVWEVKRGPNDLSTPLASLHFGRLWIFVRIFGKVGEGSSRD